MNARRLMTFFLVVCAAVWVAGCSTNPATPSGGDQTDNSANDNSSNTNDNSDSSTDSNDNSSSTDNDNSSTDTSNDNSSTTDNTNDNSSDPTTDNTNDNSSDNTNDNSSDLDPPSGSWIGMSQPCGGTKTNAMWFDDRNHGYIGCGENASGTGLFVTEDGGQTWESESLFGGVRVNDVLRTSDGTLYGAGYDAVDGYQAFIIDESGSRRELIGLYHASNSAFNSVGQGENIAVTSDGQIFVDSLTGTQAAYRAAGASEFQELETFLDDPSSGDTLPKEQVSRVVGYNNRFWAVGSTINNPGTLYYPSATGANYEMSKLELQSSTRDGELHDIYLWSETSALVCGFDQSLRYPLIFRLDGDASDLANWTQIDLFDSGIEYQGGAWKMAVRGDTVVMVGQTFPENAGFVVRSTDRGLTWEEISPVDEFGDFGANLMTNVWLFDDGTILAAGESGELWQYVP